MQQNQKQAKLKYRAEEGGKNYTSFELRRKEESSWVYILVKRVTHDNDKERKEKEARAATGVAGGFEKDFAYLVLKILGIDFG